ncbi:hypothetical protein DY000_02002172 [Brassica cretica]|uniref:Uncharacterized protein n=1 Tax=Brassica cretica TaxID=69181 RepID=A0ABQ7BXF6_BRACR|nr:hypothetical protein DY000_02002172 [Brassica cretica]
MKQLDMLSQFVQLLYQEIVFRSSDFTRLRQTRTMGDRSLCGEDELQGSRSTGEKESDGMEVCSEWLKAHGASLISDSNGDMLLDTKASTTSIFIPEPEDAVAHGERYLDVNDFFTPT